MKRKSQFNFKEESNLETCYHYTKLLFIPFALKFSKHFLSKNYKQIYRISYFIKTSGYNYYSKRSSITQLLITSINIIFKFENTNNPLTSVIVN